MMIGVRPDGSWYNIIEFDEHVWVDVAPYSQEDADRIIEAGRICHVQGVIDLFLDAKPLEVVELLVQCGLMKPKEPVKRFWQIWKK